MQITHLRIKNYRAIEALDVKIPPKGAIVKGGNARGKTTVLRAVRAALLARDIGPDAIREGADRAEILVDVDDPRFRARRTITENGSTLSVETSSQDVKKKPQTYLAELLGTAPLDPLDLFLAKPAERKKMVLAAMPARVTDEDVARWLPDFARELIPSHILELLGAMHGVDACATLHKILFEARREANASTKDAENRVGVLEKDQVEKFGGVEPSAVTAAAAAAELEQARAQWTQLDSKKKRAIEQSGKFASAREQIEQIRGRAALRREAAKDRPPEDEIIAAGETVKRLRAELAGAETALSSFVKRREAAQLATADASELDEQAAGLERTLAAAVETAPSEEEIETAKQRGITARSAHERAVAHERAEAARAELVKATEEASQRAERAKALTEIVDRLRVDAPRELLERSDAIPGLGVAGDELTLDGKVIDAVSGKEQMMFAVEVARRANAKAKFLVVDGLERLDADALPLFVEMATRDGFQLLATKVEGREMLVDVLETDSKEEAAE
ncbi:MAG TPA: hypothetical protein VGH28_10365 [Polyangiaceae bacterium]|jgi:hypothetical protein